MEELGPLDPLVKLWSESSELVSESGPTPKVIIVIVVVVIAVVAGIGVVLVSSMTARVAASVVPSCPGSIQSEDSTSSAVVADVVAGVVDVLDAILSARVVASS